MELDVEHNNADQLYEWINRFLSPFVKMSIKIECITAKPYDPCYVDIIKVYKQSIRNGDFKLENRLLKQVKQELERA